MTVSSLVDDLRAWQRKLDAMPPCPDGLRLSLKVPYGSAFRQWDTRGRLWVWMHTGAVMDVVGPRVEKSQPTGLVAMTGIPVYMEDER